MKRSIAFVALSACAAAQHPSELPEECEPNTAAKIGIVLGGGVAAQAGVNPAQQQANARCQQAIEARRIRLEDERGREEIQLRRAALERRGCAYRTGTFSMHWEPLSGNCSMPDSVVTVTSQPLGPQPQCAGSIEYSADNCHVNVNTSCPAPSAGEGFTRIYVASMNWSRDGSSGSGVAQVSLIGPQTTPGCAGTFTVTSLRK